MMRTLDDLTKEELKQVIENNPALAERAVDYCTDYGSVVYCNVDEILHDCPKTADYSIDGYYDYFSFRICNGTDFLEAAEYCEKLQHDFCLFGDDEAPAVKTISKFRRYAEVLRDDDNCYINMKSKDYNKLYDACKTYADLYAQAISKYCGDEYRYFQDAETAIDYCLEMEYFEAYRVTDDLKLVNLEELKKVFNNNGLYWDDYSIENFIENALETMQNG